MERCKALNSMIKELWRRQIEDEVEDFLFTNELVAHTLDRVSGWTPHGHVMPSPRKAATDAPLTLSSAAVGSHRTSQTQGPGTLPARAKPANAHQSQPSQLQTVWMNANWGQIAASHATHTSPRDPNSVLSSSPTESVNSNNNTNEGVKLPPPPTEQMDELLRLRDLLEDYNRLLGQLFRGGKLSVYLNNPHRRRKLARFDSMIHSEIKVLLETLGLVQSSTERQVQRHRSVMRISTSEGQSFWNSKFADGAVDVDMVPWDQFLAQFVSAAVPNNSTENNNNNAPAANNSNTTHNNNTTNNSNTNHSNNTNSITPSTNSALDPETEALLKYVLDTDNLGHVSPSKFSDFLKTFGPIEQSIANVRKLFSFKWFYGFMAVEEVIKLLADQSTGTYLVRFSRSRTDSFALEYVEERGRMRTVLIKSHMPEGVKISEENNVEKKFNSLEQLIAHYNHILLQPLQSDLRNKNWFVGDLSIEESEELLEGRVPGTYMFHFSDSRLTSIFLVCSYVKKSHNIKHVLLQKVHSGYVVAKGSISKQGSEDDLHGNSSSHEEPSPIMQHVTAESPPNAARGDLMRAQEVTPPSSSSSAPHSSVSASVVDKEELIIYPSIQDFIRANRHHLKYNYDKAGIPTLRVQRFVEDEEGVLAVSTHSPRHQTLQVDHFSVLEQSFSEPPSGHVLDMQGSDQLGQAVKCLLADRCAALSLANYPRVGQGFEVICDWFKVRLMPRTNRTLLALADGCGWGPRNREAAVKASTAFIDFMSQGMIQSMIRDTTDCKHFLLRGLTKAHEKIVEGKSRDDIWECGTTTFLGGMVMKISEQDYDFDEWAFVCVNVGDCKAFLWSNSTHQLIDITDCNRRQDMKDTGGRLGPHLKGGQPDLSNLSCYFVPCKQDDILLLMTDGVHDNLAPGPAGKTPSDMHLTAADNLWKNVAPEVLEEVKEQFQTTELTRLITEHGPRSTVGQVAQSLIDYCVRLTRSKRLFMENNPDKGEPDKYHEYPGKPDHASVICFRVGNLLPSSEHNESQPVPVSNPSTPLRTSDKTKKDKRKLKPTKTKKDGSPVTVRHVTDKMTGDKHVTTRDAKISELFDRKCQELIRHVPKHALRTYNISFMKFLSNIVDKEEEIRYSDMISGWSVSTYPLVNGTRIGDPIVDHFAAELTNNRISVALTSGSNWGERSRDSSLQANHALVDYITMEQSKVDDTVKAGLACIKACAHAHRSMLDRNQLSISTDLSPVSFTEPETCNALGAVLLRLSNTDPATQDGALWALLTVNIGEHKAYLYRQGQVIDVTPWSTSSGRLGLLQDKDDAPDLGNMGLTLTKCHEDDFVLFLSGAAHANFDPEYLGHTPKEVDPQRKEDKWSDVADPESLKRAFRAQGLSKLISGLEDCTASKITQNVIAHCRKLTSRVRLFMENNTNANMPKDHKQYPGQMGHVTCLTLRVGRPAEDTVKPERSSLMNTLYRPMKTNNRPPMERISNDMKQK